MIKPHSIVLIREPVTGIIMHKSQNDILYAAYHTNRNFALRGSSSINEVLAFLDIPYMKKAELFGWEYSYVLEHYECSWIDIESTNRPDECGIYSICYWPNPKHYPQMLIGIRDQIDTYDREWDKDKKFFTGKPEEVIDNA